jgi:hypothetical protein
MKRVQQDKLWDVRGIFLTLNLDLSLGLSMKRASWKIDQPPYLRENGELQGIK